MVLHRKIYQLAHRWAAGCLITVCGRRAYFPFGCFISRTPGHRNMAGKTKPRVARVSGRATRFGCHRTTISDVIKHRADNLQQSRILCNRLKRFAAYEKERGFHPQGVGRCVPGGVAATLPLSAGNRKPVSKLPQTFDLRGSVKLYSRLSPLHRPFAYPGEFQRLKRPLSRFAAQRAARSQSLLRHPLPAFPHPGRR